MYFSQKLYDSAGLVFPAIGVIAVLVFSEVLDPYLAYVATSWIIFGLLGLSLDIVWGRGGLLSLGQTAFYGLGGYFGSVIAINMAPVTGNTLIWSLPAGAAFGALAAAALGYIIFYARMGGLQSTILSYTLTLLLLVLTQTFNLEVGDALIGGDNGMSNIPGFILGFGQGAEELSPNAAFVLVVIIAALLYFLTRWLMRSKFGRIVNCVRIDPQKTELLGYDVRKFQLANFAYAGAIAGCAGALFGAWSNYLNPSIFSVSEAISVPIFVLVGGLGTLAGPFLGALIIGGLSFWLGGGAVGGQTTLILGIILVLLVMYLQNGVLGALDLIWKRYLPDPNEAAKETGTVQVNTNVLEGILKEAANHAGPAKELVSTDLFKRFGGVIPVNKVSRKFTSGKPFSLIGPNGAGKSSYLKTCVGLYMPESGKVMLGGDDISQVPVFDRVRKGLAVKNQKPQIYGELTVHENLWLAAYSSTKDSVDAQTLSEKIIGMLGLEKQTGVEASALSHGQQQWLDIGMVLCLSPRVLFLDEPAAGMTKEETRELSQLVRTLANYITVVVVEHDMEFVRTLEGYVTVLHQGKVFADGDIQTVRADERVLDIYLGRGKHV